MLDEFEDLSPWRILRELSTITQETILKNILLKPQVGQVRRIVFAFEVLVYLFDQRQHLFFIEQVEIIIFEKPEDISSIYLLFRDLSFCFAFETEGRVLEEQKSPDLPIFF